MGYGQLTLKSVIGIKELFELTLMATGRSGSSPDPKKGSIELTMIVGSLQYDYRNRGTMVPLGLFIQYFSGYGETLLQYDKFNRVLRAGFSYLYKSPGLPCENLPAGLASCPVIRRGRTLRREAILFGLRLLMTADESPLAMTVAGRGMALKLAAYVPGRRLCPVPG